MTFKERDFWMFMAGLNFAAVIVNSHRGEGLLVLGNVIVLGITLSTAGTLKDG